MAPVPSMNGSLDNDFERDFGSLIWDQKVNRTAFDVDRDELDIYRSGSAPPSVEGSRMAFGNLFAQERYPEFNNVTAHVAGGLLSEDEMRAHPVYLSYYYSNENLNPRLPPPAVSKEDWRVGLRAAMVGKIGDRTKGSLNFDEHSSSLFSSQHSYRELGKEFGVMMPNMEMLQQQSGYLNQSSDGLMGLSNVGIGARRKSFADVLQDQEELDLENYDNIDMVRASYSQVTQFQRSLEESGNLQWGSANTSLERVRNPGASCYHSFASGLSSSASRTVAPDHPLIRRSPSPCLPPIGARSFDSDNYSIARSNGLGGASLPLDDYNDITTAVSGLSLSENVLEDDVSHVRRVPSELSDQHGLFDMSSDKKQLLRNKFMVATELELVRSQSPSHLSGHTDLPMNNDSKAHIGLTKMTSNGNDRGLPRQYSYTSAFKKAYPVGANAMGSNGLSPNADLSSVDLSGSYLKPYGGFNGMLNSQIETGECLNLKNNQMVSAFQLPSLDPLYPQYFTGVSDSMLHGHLDSALGSKFPSASHIDYLNAYNGSLLSHQRHQYDIPLGNYSSLNHGFHGNQAYRFSASHPASSAFGIVHSHLGSSSPVRQNGHLSQTGGESTGVWNLDNASLEGSSLLEDFKSNKSVISFGLSDIVGHVVEFSGDQFGSRFIQQKLETASVEEKNKIFPEILPKAHSLMTDVFGNYVIQKFFEHGTGIQRKQLAGQLTGYVLPLSLQMYGCRVIQKALEVIDIDQQTQMILELDGNVMKCVRDQNGNHVIQKCIECVPQEKIQFIIEAFYGHVVLLSTHPYGCRVIQRVLEHSNDLKTQTIMMNEIMQSVCTLAQDQYGNYVIQHVLQYGRPQDRTAIIKELSGQIVKMSQQKYASNVVEKCLTFGTVEERQLLIDEILGTTDENEPLQAMMKDQFANYVVQKVLEKCDDHNRELILSRIKVHLFSLKKYTYGKHIVARVEKLVAAGERRNGDSSYSR